MVFKYTHFHTVVKNICTINVLRMRRVRKLPGHHTHISSTKCISINGDTDMVRRFWKSSFKQYLSWTHTLRHIHTYAEGQSHAIHTLGIIECAHTHTLA